MCLKLVQIVVAAMLITVTFQQVKIKCYDCVTPLGIEDATDYCNASIYCTGVYCTKGPDAMSNGIYHGCNDNPPLDVAGASCQKVSNNMGDHSNCYCKNIDYCNDAEPNGWKSNLVIIVIVATMTFLFIFSQ